MEEIKYKQIEHLSDTGISAYGRSLEELFENCAMGMFSIMSDLRKVYRIKKNKVEIREENISGIEDLLFSFLDELLFRYATDKMLLRGFKVGKVKKEDGIGSVIAETYGEKIDKKKHEIKVEIKAVTYHMLEVIKKNDVWNAKVIFDI